MRSVDQSYGGDSDEGTALVDCIRRRRGELSEDLKYFTAKGLTAENITDEIDGQNIACRHSNSDKTASDNDGTKGLRNSAATTSYHGNCLCH